MCEGPIELRPLFKWSYVVYIKGRHEGCEVGLCMSTVLIGECDVPLLIWSASHCSVDCCIVSFITANSDKIEVRVP